MFRGAEKFYKHDTQKSADRRPKYTIPQKILICNIK